MSYLDLIRQDQDSGRALRRAWCDAVCDKLSRDIAAEAPEGIGRTTELWERYLAGPDAALLQALRQWEKSGVEKDKQAARVAASLYLKAWKTAVQAYHTNPGRAA